MSPDRNNIAGTGSDAPIRHQITTGLRLRELEGFVGRTHTSVRAQQVTIRLLRDSSAAPKANQVAIWQLRAAAKRSADA
jgi:hypothetical protein